MTAFGKEMRREFLLQPDCAFVNHGSYGAVPRHVNDAKLRMLESFESFPDMWYRRHYWGRYEENINAIAKFLGADPQNIVFTANTSTGINCVLRCLSFKAGDKIMTYSWTYGCMKNAVQWVTEKTGAEFVMAELRVPLTKDKLIQSFEDVISEHGDSIKLAIIDVISSVPPVLMPWRELVQLCKDKGIMVLVDGAHAPGQILLDLEAMNVDFFVGNLHKWLYTHRGCAVLHTSTKHRPNLDPLVTSIFLHGDDLRRRFYYQGTDDCTTFCVVKDALKFIDTVGGQEHIQSYCRNLVTEAAAMLVKRWGTKLLEISPELEAPNMRMVRLPHLKRFPATQEVAGDVKTLFGDIHELEMEFIDRFKVVPLTLYLQGEPYVRISANIYNTMEDFERLANAVLMLKDEETCIKN